MEQWLFRGLAVDPPIRTPRAHAVLRLRPCPAHALATLLLCAVVVGLALETSARSSSSLAAAVTRQDQARSLAGGSGEGQGSSWRGRGSNGGNGPRDSVSGSRASAATHTTPSRLPGGAAGGRSSGGAGTGGAGPARARSPRNSAGGAGPARARSPRNSAGAAVTGNADGTSRSPQPRSPPARAAVAGAGAAAAAAGAAAGARPAAHSTQPAVLPDEMEPAGSTKVGRGDDDGGDAGTASAPAADGGEGSSWRNTSSNGADAGEGGGDFESVGGGDDFAAADTAAGAAAVSTAAQNDQDAAAAAVDASEESPLPDSSDLPASPVPKSLAPSGESDDGEATSSEASSPPLPTATLFKGGDVQPALAQAAEVAPPSATMLSATSPLAAMPCLLSDYVRRSTDCDANGRRQVRYVLARNCSGGLDSSALAPHSEPCDCTPEDYARTYKRDGDSCRAMYKAYGCNAGGDATNAPLLSGSSKQPATISVIADDLYCASASAPCNESNVRVVYTECRQVVVGGKALPGRKEVEVVYYFDNTCNPSAKGSIALPPSAFVPCDKQCGAGLYLSAATCQPCPAGTFSVGGGQRWEAFSRSDLASFTTECVYTNSSGRQNCNGWRVENGMLNVGPFDPPNDWYPEECADPGDSTFRCHNDLRAALSLPVFLVHDGHVKFRFTVSAEADMDGLSFFVDSQEEPLMALESYSFHRKEVEFRLPRGMHQLTWVYSKDVKWTRGRDAATISFIEIIGTTFNDRHCTPCPAGTYSAEGASSCQPCLPDQISLGGAESCTPCGPSTYSLSLPRTKCAPRPVCNASVDAAASFSPCRADTRTRTKTWAWLEPHFCVTVPTEPASHLPQSTEEPCPPCPAGQQATTAQDSTTVTCTFCPPGTARSGNETLDAAMRVRIGAKSAEDTCYECGDGQVAIKVLSLKHVAALAQTLPPYFSTGCSGDCASSGWRWTHGSHFDAGVNHGPSVSVWLAMDITMQQTGYLWYNFSVDIPPWDSRKALFFYIDDVVVEDVEDESYDDAPVDPGPQVSGPWQLKEGKHRVMWVWVKAGEHEDQEEADEALAEGEGGGGAGEAFRMHPQARPDDVRGTALIYGIEVLGSSVGGAVECRGVPEGTEMGSDRASWVECPAGKFGRGGTAACEDCPINTFNPEPGGGSGACQPCGPGTTARAGSVECIVGDAFVATSFCTFMSAPTDLSGGSTFVLFDLSPLSRLHPGRAFGPVYNDPTDEDRDRGTQYWVSVCTRDESNATCFDYNGASLNTFACEVPGKLGEGYADQPGHRLGTTVTLESMATVHRALVRRGMVMRMTGDECAWARDRPRSLNVTFVCDPSAGYGAPEAWTEGGLAAVFDPSLGYPEWAAKGGHVIPVDGGGRGSCERSMVWYSAFACPLCALDDFRRVEMSQCTHNARATYDYKTPRTCQPNPQVPLPTSTPCEPCTHDDYEQREQDCLDASGRRNVTYGWRTPKLCNESLPGSVDLPRDVLAGPCLQETVVVGVGDLKPIHIAVLALLTLLIAALSLISFVTWLRSRRLYAKYAELVKSEEGVVSAAAGEHGDYGSGLSGHRNISEEWSEVQLGQVGEFSEAVSDDVDELLSSPRG